MKNSKSLRSNRPRNRKALKGHARALAVLAAAFVGICALLLFGAQAYNRKIVKPESSRLPLAVHPTAQINTGSPDIIHSLLTRQPSAARMRLLLGQRFVYPGREISNLSGKLVIGGQVYEAGIVRTQDESGEQVAIYLNGAQEPLTWTGTNGTLAAGNQPTSGQISMSERIALDSPDQFVLAQLRKASYYAIAQNVRPSEAGASDDYDGPVWDVVRVGEPENPNGYIPLSPWRTYYINSTTGLIDKIVSQEGGVTTVAEISEWVEVNGETLAGHISWKQDGQVVMEFVLSSAGFSQR